MSDLLPPPPRPVELRDLQYGDPMQGVHIAFAVLIVIGGGMFLLGWMCMGFQSLSSVDALDVNPGVVFFWFFAALIGLLCAPASVVTAIAAVALSRKHRLLLQQGEVVQAEVVQNKQWTDYFFDFARVTYAFEVNGKQYRGSFEDGRFKGAFNLKEGDLVTVFYDQHKPTVNVFEGDAIWRVVCEHTSA